MRKNRTKHEAKKPRLAKRALALCFALIFVCSCLLPAFANSEAGALAGTAVVEEQDEQKLEDSAPLNEGGTDSTEGNEEQDEQKQEEANASKETSKEPSSSSSGEASGESQSTAPSESASSEGSASTAPGESASSSSASSEASGEPEQPASSEPKTEQPASSEQPANSETKTEETKPEQQPTTNTTGDTIEQGKATYTYRFWPDKIDAFELEAINDDVKSGTSLNDAAQSRAGKVPCTVLTVMTNANLRDYQANVQQPTKDGYEFAGWYTVDGTTEDEFSFEQSLNFEESKTIDVFAKWEKVESTVEDEMEKTEPTTEDELEKTEPGKANESKEETLPPVEKTGAVGLANNDGDTVSIAVKAENLPGKVNELVVTDLNEDEEGAAFGNALGASNYADWTVTNLMVNITPKDAEGKTVEPNEAVTVHFSGLESLMIQYSTEMDLKVLHMKRDGTLEALSLKNIQTKETQEGTVLSSFAVSTTSFSPFVLAASESASVEPANLTLESYRYGTKLTVGESIVIKSDWNYINHQWYTSDKDALKIVANGIDSNGKPYVRVKALRTIKSVTIRYSKNSNKGGSKYTFEIVDSRGDQTADIFFLKTPGKGADSNSEGYWLPASGKTDWKVNEVPFDGTINTTGAKWDLSNKNVMLTDPDNATGTYVLSWPDGSNQKTWTLYKTCTDEVVKKNNITNKETNEKAFSTILGMIWNAYKEELAKDLNVDDATTLDSEKITQITLTPYKISSNTTMHIDCTISATGIAYTANFWVEEPGETSYKQVYAKNYANNVNVKKPTNQNMVDWVNQNGNKVSLIKNKKGLPETVEEHGVTYRFAGWYPEGNPDTTPNLDHATVSFDGAGYPPSAEEKQNGVVNFYARYVADNQGRLDEYPYITVEKQIKGLPSDKVDELLKTFKVNVGNGIVLDHNDSSFTKSTDNGVTTLRWKIDRASAGSYHVTEEGYTVNGYTLKEKVGDGETFNVKEATFDADAEVFTPNNVNDFKVGTIGEQYWVFVISLTSSRNVVISNRTLSAKERASIIKAVADEKKAIGNQSTVDATDFYSITQNQEIELTDKKDTYKIRYNDYNDVVHGPGIHIEHTSNWNMVASVKYTMADAKSADIKLTNTYTPATTSLTVTKATKKDGVADNNNQQEFEFTLTLGDNSKNVTWTKGTEHDAVRDTTHKFTLKGGESIIFSGINVNDDVTVTETDYTSQHYTTTVDNVVGHEKTIKSATLKQNQERGETVAFVNEYTTPKLESMTIKKVVTGAFGERNKEFTFNVTLTKDGKTATGANHSNVNGISLNSFTLKHGQQVELNEIPIGTTITITEEDANEYKTSATGHKKPIKTSGERTFTYKVEEDESGKAVLKSVGDDSEGFDGTAITVENNFDGNPDTGVLLDTLPYLILLAVAVAGGVLVVVRKHKHRDE